MGQTKNGLTQSQRGEAVETIAPLMHRGITPLAHCFVAKRNLLLQRQAPEVEDRRLLLAVPAHEGDLCDPAPIRRYANWG